MHRVYAIDYLRGILAFFIMLYHYLNWQNFFIPDSTSFLTRNAIYGVSLFFIISGFSLTVTYVKVFKFFSFKDICKFFIKRFARIYPLFWLITFIYLSLAFLSGKNIPDLYHILSNLTISFSFFNEYNAFTAGGWSIGIEILLYLFFPLLILFLNKTNIYGELLFMLFIFISMYISSYLFYDISDAENYWTKYLHLINHIYFFIFGILVAVVYQKNNNLFIVKKSLIELFFTFTLIVFIFYPIFGEVINLLLDENRIILTICVFSIFILVVMYDSHLNHKSKILKIFNFFGEISYTLYLVHPIVYMITNYFVRSQSILKVIIMVFLTIALSSVIYRLYELKIQSKIVLLSKKYV